METNTVLICCTSILVLICSYLVFHVFIVKHVIDEKPSIDLAVCILSARNNTDLRDVIRKTWLKTTEEKSKSGERSVVPKFVVGSTSCDIHPDNRISPHSCQRWKFTLPADPSQDIFVFSALDESHHSKRSIVSSVMIETMHPIILKRVGLVEFFPFDKIPKSAHIVLYDEASEEEIGRARFTNSFKGNLMHGYYYKPVEELWLPKNYEFTVHLEISADQDHGQMADFLEGIMANINMSTTPLFKEEHKGLLVVKYLHGFQYATDANENPLAVPLMSLIFNVGDDKSLWKAFESGARKDMSWQRDINQEAAALAQESNLHDDILVVDLMDVYRNLPRKLLLCHQWFYEHYKTRFLLKTDDDCFISLPTILTHLSQINSHEDPLWWGNFRRNWLVERHGKWKEERYTASVYPAFACGSGNVVSRPIHSLLVNNSHAFNLYQGEDVSMGIWLSAFDVRREHDTRWRCTKSCTDDMIALPQLNAESIAWHWNNSKHCPSSCESC